MSYTSLTITKKTNLIWGFTDNTMAVGAEPRLANVYSAIGNPNNTVTFLTKNGGILYENIPATIINYIDELDPSNNFSATTALSLIAYLKEDGFFGLSDNGEGGVTAFTELNDTPDFYIGNGLKTVRVNASETALEFAHVTGINQNNIDIQKRFNYTPGDTLAQIRTKINALPSFTISEIQSVWFHGVSLVPSYIVKFKMMRKGKGTYGVGGTLLTEGDLNLVYSGALASEDIYSDPTTQTIAFSLASGQTISQWLNTQNPPIEIQDQEDGYVLFQGADADANPLSYLWLSDGGSYGVGGDTSSMTDFQLLNSNPPSIYEASHKPVKVVTTSTPGYAAGTYTLQFEDRNYWLSFNIATAFNVHVPNYIFSGNTLIEGDVQGDGQATFTVTSLITLSYPATELPKTAEKHSVFGLKFRTANNIVLFGRLELI